MKNHRMSKEEIGKRCHLNFDDSMKLDAFQWDETNMSFTIGETFNADFRNIENLKVNMGSNSSIICNKIEVKCYHNNVVECDSALHIECGQYNNIQCSSDSVIKAGDNNKLDCLWDSVIKAGDNSSIKCGANSTITCGCDSIVKCDANSTITCGPNSIIVRRDTQETVFSGESEITVKTANFNIKGMEIM